MQYPKQIIYNRKKQPEYHNEVPLIGDILWFLTNMRIVAWRNQVSGKWSPRKKKHIKEKYVRTGVSDILGIFPATAGQLAGHSLAVECKTINDRLTLDQKIFLKDINDNGGVGLKAESVNDVIDKLTEIDYIKVEGDNITVVNDKR